MTLLRGGRVVTPDGVLEGASLRIEGETITGIGALEPETGEDVLDCSGCVVLPGGVESHCHLDLEAGDEVTADDFATGTRAALAGGTTTVIDFATQFHGQSLATGLARWCAKAAGRAVTDFAFHLAMTQWRDDFPEQMAAMVERGVTSFKLYMAYRDTMMVDDEEILAALTASRELGATIGFHCENGLLVDALRKAALAAGHTTPHFHASTRPAVLEVEAVERLEVIAGLVGAPHYVVHLSTAGGLDAVRRGRASGTTVAAETCPQYLLLDVGAYGGPEDDDPRRRAFVMSPPLRTAADREALWAGLAAGDVQFVGTDHCSFDLVGQKDKAADFAAVPNGIPGIELRMALLYSAGVAAGRLDLTRFAEVTATNAARYFGLYPRKGALVPGADADVLVHDPATRWTVTHSALHENVDHTPYEGAPVQGRVRDVFHRGHHAVVDGRLADGLPPGRYLPCGAPDTEVR
ncbi:MAG TPA: dihydropyrimidinase [Phycicoccus sp.]|nr:dihydropyrimidinase [Phycicoccus sp.]